MKIKALLEAKYSETPNKQDIDDVITDVAETLTDYISQRGWQEKGEKEIARILTQAANNVSFEGLAKAFVNRIQGDADWTPGDISTINDVTETLWKRTLINIDDVKDSLEDEDEGYY